MLRSWNINVSSSYSFGALPPPTCPLWQKRCNPSFIIPSVIFHFRQRVSRESVPTDRRLGGGGVLDVSVCTFGRRYLPHDCRGLARRGSGDSNEGDVVRPRWRRTSISVRLSRFRPARTSDRLPEHPDERHRTGLLAAACLTRRDDDFYGDRCFIG